MIINNSSIKGTANLYAQQNKALEIAKKPKEKKVSSKPTKAAEVTLSVEAKELAKATQTENNQRLEHLAKLKSEIKAGTYRPDAEEIAESMLKRFWGGNRED
ncbi:MAG TPA: flagellar biosynthesis anti-sigma factor FlgM [Firmicutes bacterium]|jgi:flagellar biosynthesis anti-sigma factor FlgM|nr:flagellar biosynthesis anti-sigma factor FlgM [Bacillota bacterium]